jgi:hypothetical protein
LLQGSGTAASTAGDDISLRVVPLDALGNVITQERSRSASYTVNITCITPASDNVTAGEVVLMDQPLSYVLLDDSHGKAMQADKFKPRI